MVMIRRRNEDVDVEGEDEEEDGDVEEENRSQDRKAYFLPEPAQSKCTWTFHKSHYILKFSSKMPDANPLTHVLCEPAQSKRTWTFHSPEPFDM